MAHPDSPNDSALLPEEILRRFLAPHGIGVSLQQSDAFCEACGVITNTSVRTIARRLERRISKLGFQLKPKYAIEAVCKIKNHLRGVYTRQQANDTNHEFVVFLKVDGEEVDAAYFSNLKDAVTRILVSFLELTPVPPEPALCSLQKLPSGFILDMKQAKSRWFELFLNCFRDDNSEIGLAEPVWLEEEELRSAFDRVVATIERARPAVLINGGAVPRTIEPWCVASFQVDSLDGTQYPLIDEATRCGDMPSSARSKNRPHARNMPQAALSRKTARLLMRQAFLTTS